MKYKKNDKIYLDPNLLHPTQFCLGYKEVKFKEEKLVKMSDADYELYLVEKITPVIIGPNEKLYLVDHHHHTRSLLNINKTKVYIHIIDDFSNQSDIEFEKSMVENGYVNLIDENHQSKSFNQLPSSLKSMNHDYYRSLAWSVREAGGFEKVDEILFFEFRWGEYFRKYITLDLIKDDFELATMVGLKMAKKPLAKDLPGYIKDL